MGKNRRAIPVENKFRRQWQAIDRAGLNRMKIVICRA